ncbi:hypothetical protein OKA04_04900 [Luteolibacter flavescens]|uniref:Zinc ribbon domain-containing protein n=1 Tax=Luteolibacter flavescens TaxID=1859460 RepID=A0ABT3FKH3_9BACT|nr:hypothetical protein [Luteolibacter flavescens]MCW1884056.1 hypothetical protein [Luteolibacter flavescens]
MSDTSGAWFHCSRCGALFHAAAAAGQRGACPECGGDPVTGAAAGANVAETAAPVRVRRKVRKPKDPSGQSKRRRRGSGKKARALAIFVVLWALALGGTAIMVKKLRPDADENYAVVDTVEFGGQALADSQLLQDKIEGCRTRLMEFLAATDISGQTPHVLRADKILPEMARAQQYTPIFPSRAEYSTIFQNVIHTPGGSAIEVVAQEMDDGKKVEAVFFEEEGEWKIDWHDYTRANSAPWPLFLAEKGDAEGTFRVLARERIGAGGRDPSYIGLVLYTPRPGNPGEAVAPSPEVRVERSSEIGRAIEQAFADRAKGLAPYGSGVTKYDPDEMIRLHVRMTREGEVERVFQITELIGTHWMELPPTSAK